MMIWEPYVDYDRIIFHPAPRPKGKRVKKSYAAEVCAFDIETTALRDLEQSIMYVWQFSVENRVVIMGRTWDQYIHMLSEIQNRLAGMTVVIYVHNLSYEFQYLSGIYPFKPDEVFATEAHKVLRCEMLGSFEYRCSLRLTNMALAAAANRYNTRWKKFSGSEFGYDVIRFPDTPLHRKELLYCCYDVLSVVEMVHRIMDLNNDDLYTIPATSTGFVRRHVKNAMRSEHDLIDRLYPSYPVFLMLRAAFRGGNTHANRYYSGYTIDEMQSMDISSSYPHQQICQRFPMSAFKECNDRRQKHIDFMMVHGYALLLHISIKDCRLLDPYITVPYLPFSKCQKWSRDCRLDNGRILSASYVEFCCTDIDYIIIRSQYTGQYEILDCYKSAYDYLPDPIRDSNREFYRLKTELKGVAGQELYYFKNKELLNSIYGMSVQNPVKLSMLYQSGDFLLDLSKTPEQILDQHRHRAFTVYQWGVWTTSHARHMLQEGIDLCGDLLVYVDTDSCKFIEDPKILQAFEALNAQTRQQAIKCGAYADDPKGIRHYTGIYEDDGRMQAFRTLGAKKYAYTDDKGKLHLTVSGVSKKAGAKELLDSGGLDIFSDGFIFKNSGKLAVKYQNINEKINYQNRELTITNNAYLYPVDYTLGLTEEYAQLLNISAKTLKKVQEFYINRHIYK